MALGFVLFAVLLIFIMVNAQNSYAVSVIITPNPIMHGSSFQVSGAGVSPTGQPFSVSVLAFTSGSSVLPPLMEQTGVVGALAR